MQLFYVINDNKNELLYSNKILIIKFYNKFLY